MLREATTPPHAEGWPSGYGTGASVSHPPCPQAGSASNKGTDGSTTPGFDSAPGRLPLGGPGFPTPSACCANQPTIASTMRATRATRIRLRDSIGPPAVTFVNNTVTVAGGIGAAQSAEPVRYGLHPTVDHPCHTDTQRQEHGGDQNELNREPLLCEPQLEAVPPAGHSVEHTTERTPGRLAPCSPSTPKNRTLTIRCPRSSWVNGPIPRCPKAGSGCRCALPVSTCTTSGPSGGWGSNPINSP